MASKGEDLADRFEKANTEFIATVSGLSDEQWKAPCAGEQWPAGVLAHHVAEDHGVLAGLINTIATGGQLPPIDAKALDAMNAEHAQRAAGVSRDETVALAKSEGTKAAALLRSLSDEQLERTSPFGVTGGDISAEQIAENILIGHMGMHLPSIRAAVS